MKPLTNNSNFNNVALCPKCKGQGKKSKGIPKKVKHHYQKQLELAKQQKQTVIPVSPKAHTTTCNSCLGSGLTITDTQKNIEINTELPHISIIGGGIGGMALAVACTHRGIPFTLYERDRSFDERHQGYGLTLQQASKELKALGITSLKDSIISTKHKVYNTSGNLIAEWGNRKWIEENAKKTPKRTNLHISRQSLRHTFLEQLQNKNIVKWGHQLIDIQNNTPNQTTLQFKVGSKIKTENTHIVVGADGIRSTVRKTIMGDKDTSLNYLGCIVILGICSLSELSGIQSKLLDGSTVFQTANGYDRMYAMPYDANAIMWQFSFPLTESKAKELSKEGATALKEIISQKVKNWHAPIPEIVFRTETSLITGYPVYDRVPLTPNLLNNNNACTLIGDAAHPMSPFKGQGANQAILDALLLAREVSKRCSKKQYWEKEGIRKSVLTSFEANMLERSTKKVIDSAKAVHFLHSKEILHPSNEPRKQFNKKKL